MGLSILFAVLGSGAAFLARGLRIEQGFGWGFLPSDGDIALFVIVCVLGGVTLGVIAGKKLCCPQRRVSGCGAVAAFLCAGVAGIGVPVAMDVLGVLRADEVFSFLLDFLVVMPLSAVLGYDLGAWTESKVVRPQVT